MRKEINENCKLNWSFWLSIFAIAISSITILFFLCEVTPYCKAADNLTFISVIAAFIGISVTLVIGFQIYSFISIKDKMKEYASLKSELAKTNASLKMELTQTNCELHNTKENLLLLEYELKGTIEYSEGMIHYGQKHYGEAFEKIQSALIYYARLDSKKELLTTYIKLLKVCMNELSQEEFSSDYKELQIDTQQLLIQNNNIKLKEAKFYWVIKDSYEDIYTDFQNKIRSFKHK